MLADAGPLDEVGAVSKRLGVIKRDASNLAQGLLGEEGLVAGHYHVGEGAQARSDGVNDLTSAILINVGAFLVIDVQSCGANLARQNATDKGLGVNETATTGRARRQFGLCQ